MMNENISSCLDEDKGWMLAIMYVLYLSVL